MAPPGYPVLLRREVLSTKEEAPDVWRLVLACGHSRWWQPRFTGIAEQPPASASCAICSREEMKRRGQNHQQARV